MASVYSSTDNLNATAVAVSAVATQFDRLIVTNTSGATAFVQCFDVATVGGVTLGTTIPVISIFVANNATFDEQIGFLFTTGLVIASTTTYKGATGSSNGVLATVGHRPN